MGLVSRAWQSLRRCVRVFARLANEPGVLLVALRVYTLLIMARLMITVVPMRQITRRLGERGSETPRDGVSDQQLRYAWRVGAMIKRLSPYTPTNSNCYPQGLVAWWMLSRRGIPTTYYYGARFDKAGASLEAHVWVRCGPLIVTGGLVSPYKPLSTYARGSAQAVGFPQAVQHGSETVL